MDLLFYFYASIGVILFGISKGGFAGPVAILIYSYNGTSNESN